MSDLLGPKRRSAAFADLLSASRAGEQWAVEALAAEYLPRLTAFATARGAVDPEGMADVVLLSVVQRLDRLDFEVPAQLWAYLCMTARSRIIDEYRANKPVELVGDHGAFDRTGTASGQDLVAFENEAVDRDYVDGLLAPLTDEQRQVLELRFLDDLSIETTADLTGRTEGAVKGLQRRAINAILAAVAVIAIVLVVRGLDGPAAIQVDEGPAERPDQVDGPDRNGDTGQDGEPGQEEDSLRDTSTGTVDGGEADANPLAVGSGESEQDGTGSQEPAADGDRVEGSRVDVSSGTDRSVRLDVSGEPGEASTHGVRVRCSVSHLSFGDPIGGVGPRTAFTHWGNTAVDGAGRPDDLATTGSGTCEGGVADRSAYWMPTLFDEADQAVLPELTLIEFKAFGGPTWDRGLLRPIPTGLVLVAEPTVPGAGDRFGPASGTGSVRLAVAFPSCVQVDQAGRPVLSSPDRVSHLAYLPGGEGCPTTHPYRIPQLTYALTYDVPFGSDWYLASAGGAGQGERRPTGGAIAAWTPEANDDLVRCVRDLLVGCWFRGLDDGAGRELAADADRTPFGTAVTPVENSRP